MTWSLRFCEHFFFVVWDMWDFLGAWTAIDDSTLAISEPSIFFSFFSVGLTDRHRLFSQQNSWRRCWRTCAGSKYFHNFVEKIIFFSLFFLTSREPLLARSGRKTLSLHPCLAKDPLPRLLPFSIWMFCEILFKLFCTNFTNYSVFSSRRRRCDFRSLFIIRSNGRSNNHSENLVWTMRFIDSTPVCTCLMYCHRSVAFVKYR